MVMSKIDRAQELLGQYCAGGYANGFLGEANARYLEDNFAGLVRVYDIYRLGPTACLLDGADEDEPRLDELLELLEGLADYHLIDDSYLSDLISKDEERVVADYANDWDIPEEYVWDAIRELDFYFEWEQDYVYLVGDEAEVKAKASELGQTWSAHYNSEMSHIPEVCGYCAEAKEVA
jgi:hypothetical protein